MQVQRNSLRLLRYGADFFSILISFGISLLYTLYTADNPFSLNENFFLAVLIITWFITANSTGVYDEFRSRDFSFELIAVLKNVFAQSIAAIIILFFLQETYFPRTFVISYTLLLTLFLILERFALRRLLNFLRKKGKNQRSVLIIGPVSII